jgi:hypothetical protein
MFNAFFGHIHISTHISFRYHGMLQSYTKSILYKERKVLQKASRKRAVSGISISTEYTTYSASKTYKNLGDVFSLSENIITRGAPRHFCIYLNKMLRLFHSLKDQAVFILPWRFLSASLSSVRTTNTWIQNTGGITSVWEDQSTQTKPAPVPLRRPRSKPKPPWREAQTNRLRYKVKEMWPMRGAVGRRPVGFVVDNAAL